jgi:hypothetical protein
MLQPVRRVAVWLRRTPASRECTTYKEVGMSLLCRRTAIALSAWVLAGSFASVASAAPKAPTNGGNGAGQSGQCTSNPDDCPAPCPGT